MSAKRSLHHVPGPREQGAGRLLLTFHRALALQRKGSSGEIQKSLPVPGLESGEGWKRALEVFTRKSTPDMKALWTAVTVSPRLDGGSQELKPVVRFREHCGGQSHSHYTFSCRPSESQVLGSPCYRQ